MIPADSVSEILKQISLYGNEGKAGVARGRTRAHGRGALSRRTA